MKKGLTYLLLLFSIVLVRPYSATASKPIQATLEGCVIKGVFYAVEKGGTERGAPQVNAMDLLDLDESVRKLDLSPYEGKKIRLQGRLHPADLFEPDPKSLKVLGSCDRDSKAAIIEYRKLVK
jgi:hypothetical protein